MTKSEKSSLPNFRKIFTIIIIINILFLVERSVFDFFGFMFSMIIADIIYLIFLVIGLFGALQFRVNYVVSLTLTTLLWIAWNIFIICVYLNIGNLNRYDPVLLNLNTGRTSWWFTSSFSCKTEISSELEKLQIQEQLNLVRSIDDSTSSIKTQSYKINSLFLFNTDPKYKYLNRFIETNCLIPFHLVEIIHSGILILFGIFLIIFGLLLSNALNDEDDSFDYIGGFDTAHMLSQNYNLEQQQTLTRNAHIRLEPLPH
ncbi:unnamed protein product [Brachionus calyciflorus]|uniref:Sodium/potassium-transporting ATPase subunit beta-1-interacting protein n=1 Tax=Brachionus calyciflorus TaxID=104777 RepID=A0A813NX12_9BILA|nr:unnamed protein product [Brachionus calyciflorus]